MRIYQISVAFVVLATVPAFAAMDDADMEKAVQTAQMAGLSAARFELCGIKDTPRIRRSLLAFARSCGGSADQITLIGDVADGARIRGIREQRASDTSCPISQEEARSEFREMADKLSKLAAYNNCGD